MNILSTRFRLSGSVIHKAAESQRSWYLRVGDPRPAAGRRRLRQVQRAFRLQHQPDPAEQAGRRGAVPRPAFVPRAATTLLAAASALRLLCVPSGE